MLSQKLLIKIYESNAFTFYCGCSFKLKKPNFSSCGYIPKKDNERANYIARVRSMVKLCAELYIKGLG